jgi:selenocysteine lyase/cysteine desulfurase
MPDHTDWAAYRALFPALKKWAYFAWAATAPLSARAADAMRRQIAGARDEGGGAGTWKEWYETYERVRHATAALTGAAPEEIALLKNTSEGVSTVAFGLDWKAGDNLVLPHGEFPANVYPWLALRERGVELRRIAPDSAGRFTREDVARLMDDRTRLVALSFVSYATGFRADLGTIGKLCRDRGIFLFVDAIQGLGALPFDVRTMAVDAFAADGHKWLCAPEGLALFYVRREHHERLRPLSRGWWSVAQAGRYELEDQPLADSARRYECGTLPTANAYGLRAALELVHEVGIEAISARIRELTGKATQALRSRGFKVLRAEGEGEWSGIVSCETPGGDPKPLAADLEKRGVLVTARGGRLRLAVHAWNDEGDIERLLDALP